jgi:hypothetical protein
LLGFFQFEKNSANRKAVIHEYKIEENSLAQTDSKPSLTPKIQMSAHHHKSVNQFYGSMSTKNQTSVKL